MKHFIKIIPAILLFTLVSCMKEKKSLHVGSDWNYPPFVYIEEENGEKKYKGYEVDILNKLAERLGFKIEYDELQFKNLIEAVESERIDIGIGGIAITPRRQEKVLFANHIYKSPNVTILHIDNTSTTEDDFDNNRLYVLGDDDFAEHIQNTLSKRYEKLKVNVYQYLNDILPAFKDDKGAIFLVDEDYANQLLAKNKQIKVTKTLVDPYGVSVDNINGHPIAFAFNKKHKALVGKINNELRKMEEDGTMKKIREKNNMAYSTID